VDLQATADLVMKLTPADLPPVPWALKVAERKVVGTGLFLGGPYVTVKDNERFLRSLQDDVAQGPDGPRARTGAIQADLVALVAVLAARKETA